MSSLDADFEKICESLINNTFIYETYCETENTPEIQSADGVENTPGSDSVISSYIDSENNSNDEVNETDISLDAQIKVESLKVSGTLKHSSVSNESDDESFNVPENEKEDSSKHSGSSDEFFLFSENGHQAASAEPKTIESEKNSNVQIQSNSQVVKNVYEVETLLCEISSETSSESSPNKIVPIYSSSSENVSDISCNSVAATSSIVFDKCSEFISNIPSREKLLSNPPIDELLSSTVAQNDVDLNKLSETDSDSSNYQRNPIQIKKRQPILKKTPKRKSVALTQIPSTMSVAIESSQIINIPPSQKHLDLNDGLEDAEPEVLDTFMSILARDKDWVLKESISDVNK